MNDKSMNVRTKSKLCWIYVIISLGLVNNVFAGITSSEIRHVTYKVPLNKSLLVNLDRNVTKISKPNPGIAEVLLFPPRQLFLRGKGLGTTNVIIWGKDREMLQVVDVEVTHDLETLKRKLYELLPTENIEVRSAQKNIVLSGEVTSLEALQAAIDLAQGYLGSSTSMSKKGGGKNTGVQVSSGKKNRELSKGDIPQVINLMSVGGGQQVMLEVKVAEIDRRLAREFEVDFQTINTSLLEGLVGGTSSGLKQASFNATSVFLSAISGQYMMSLTVNGVDEQGLAKILAEPTLTTLSGQEATFLSGGEFPIPVAQSASTVGGTAITVEFKEFGIGLRFIPVVLDSGRINLNMNVSVSELSDAASIVAGVGIGDGLLGGDSARFAIPSLTKREASSTLELADGQTMSIAGLISDRLRESVSQFPGLGDIPVLGVLFRSTKFLNQKTELVIFVTPHLAKPVLAKDVVLPTDSFVEPDEIDTYIFGRLESRKARRIIAEDDVSYMGEKGGIDGVYGHQFEAGDE